MKRIGEFFDKYFFFALFAILVLSFVLLEPKVSALIFPLKRQLVFQNFIKGVKRNGKIDPQEYWQFREFYSPGYFLFNRNGLSAKDIGNFEQNAGVEKGKLIPFLLFTSTHLKSIDALTTDNVFFKNLKIPSGSEIIFQTSGQQIYKNNGRYTILFELRVSDMKRANGFFDYTGTDKKLVEGKYWVNITLINP